MLYARNLFRIYVLAEASPPFYVIKEDVDTFDTYGHLVVHVLITPHGSK